MVHSVYILYFCQLYLGILGRLEIVSMNFLYDQDGQRKYLTVAERQRFLRAAQSTGPDIYTFCATLAYTGGRISEILALAPDRIDYTEKFIVLPCLKKRRSGINRAIPVPDSLIQELKNAHGPQLDAPDQRAERIWPWSRTTAWKHVKSVMVKAGIEGVHACPKGLRHSFGVNALQAKVPITLVQKWLGHARLSTTAIYADAIGAEERAVATRLWKNFS